MKILLVILSLQIAFPSLGYGIADRISCHSVETEKSCCTDSKDDDCDKSKSCTCGDDCSCACCFMLQVCMTEKNRQAPFAMELFVEDADFIKKPLRFDLQSTIWQPPKRA